METKANYVMIGLFTLAAVMGVFGFIYWFQNIGGSGERAIYRVVFDGSVSGLRTGGSVLFNGIRVGEVTGLSLNPEHPQQVIANISIDKSVSVRADTEVGLEFQGLTGIAAVALKGGSPSSPPLVPSPSSPPILVASPGATQDVTQAAREALRKLDGFIEENRQAFHSALKNIDEFSGALARNSARIDKIAEGMQNLTGGPDGKSGEINDAARSLRRMTDTAGRQIEQLSADAHRTLDAIERAVKNLDRNPSRLIFGGSGTSQIPEYNGRR